MAVVTNYAGTLTSPTTQLGYFVRPESKVKLGTGSLWAALDNTSYLYTTYEASIGLQAGETIEIGSLNALSFNYAPDRQPIEIINIADSPAYELVGEETTVSMELLEWQPDVLAIVIGSGQYHTVTGNDALIRFGGGCVVDDRPLVIEGVNASCQAGSVTDLNDGLEAYVFTLYKAICTSGMSADFTAAENSPVATEWTLLPQLTLDGGNRLGNLYFYSG
jgi:hypothetical protein